MTLGVTLKLSLCQGSVYWCCSRERALRFRLSACFLCSACVSRVASSSVFAFQHFVVTVSLICHENMVGRK